MAFRKIKNNVLVYFFKKIKKSYLRVFNKKINKKIKRPKNVQKKSKSEAGFFKGKNRKRSQEKIKKI